MSVEGLAAVSMLGAGAYISHAVALRMFPEAGAAERWSIAAVVGVSSAIGAFQVLALLEAFRLGVVVAGCAVAALGAAIVTRKTPRFVFRTIASDLDAGIRFTLGTGSWPSRLLRALFAALMLLMPARAIVLPPLGWDAITYHATKAAIWVQTGGALPFDLPGGWALYRHYPAGGEILGAFAMLPFHDDTLYLWVDVAVWLMWAPVLTLLQRELSVPKRYHAAVTAYLMCVSSIYFFIPSGYVEPTLYFLIYAGMWLIIRALRGTHVVASAALGTLALATAATVKITALPFAALGAIALCAKYFRNRPEFRHVLAGLAWGAGLSVLTLGLMLLKNIHEQGAPLSPYSLEVFGLVLGEGSKQFEVYSESLRRLVDSREAFRNTLMPFGVVTGLEVPSLGPLALIWGAAGLVGMVHSVRRRPYETIFVASVALFQLGLFFSPGLEAVRTTHGSVTGRFLHAFLSVCVLLSLGLPRARSVSPLVVGVLVLVTSATCMTQLVAFASGVERDALVGMGALLLVAGFFVSRQRSDPRDVRVGAGLLVGLAVALVLGAAPLRAYRDALRYRAAEEAMVAHEVPRGWVRNAKAVDQPAEPLNLAITKGFTPAYNEAFTYFFLGRRLQNSLRYVSVRADGAVPEYLNPAPVPRDEMDEAAWVRRVIDGGVDYVVMLPPIHIEQRWMTERPQHFENWFGDSRRPGVFRVRKNRDAAKRGGGARLAPAPSLPRG